MIDSQTDAEVQQAPSKGVIAKATVIALLAALIVLLVAVLPAEYGIDPLKTGKLLGLTGIATASQDNSADNAKGRVVATSAPGQAAIFTAESKIYKVDSQDFLLSPGDGVEMKYHLQKGAGMVYSWKADGRVPFEFHGEPDQKPSKDYYESYELDDKAGRDAAYGSFTAPTTGIHGWFWQNKSRKNVNIHLTVAGFFDGARMYVDGQPQEMPLEDAK